MLGHAAFGACPAGKRAFWGMEHVGLHVAAASSALSTWSNCMVDQGEVAGP